MPVLFLVYRENLGLGRGETPGKLNPLTEKDPEKSMQLCLHKSDPHLWPYRARPTLCGTKTLAISPSSHSSLSPTREQKSITLPGEWAGPFVGGVF